MSNAITWRSVAKSINNDTEIMESLVESAQAPEKVARSPAHVFLRMMDDVGDAGFECLPEPNSDQEKKCDGLGFHIGDNLRAVMDADPTRHWDKYFYKQESGETADGSVYVDMMRDTDVGKAYFHASEVLKSWNGKDAKPATLQQTVEIDGVTHECSRLDPKQRGDMAGMLDGRILNMANAMRRVVGIWRTKKDIEKRLSEYAEVSFVYNIRDEPTSGLANTKKPIMLLELNSNKQSDRYGQRTGFSETFAPTVFIKLDVDKAVSADGKVNRYSILKDSRKERAVAAPKAGASTKDAGKAAIEGRVSSNNLLTVMSNVRVFIEDEESKRHTYNRIAAMTKDDSAELLSSLLDFRDWIAEFDTPDNRAIQKEYSGTRLERAKDAAAAKAEADKATAEAEAQPTQNERNAQLARDAQRTAEGEDVEAAKQRAAEANTPKAKPAPSVKTGGRRKVG